MRFPWIYKSEKEKKREKKERERKKRQRERGRENNFYIDTLARYIATQRLWNVID